MDDGNVEIKTSINTDDVENGLKKIKSDVKKTTEDLTKDVEDYARKNEEALKKSIEALEVEARAKGKSLSAQDRYNVSLKSYIDLINKSNGKVKEGDPIAAKRLAQLQKEKKALDENIKKHKKFGDVLKSSNPKVNSFVSNLQGVAASGGAAAVAIGAAVAVTKKLIQTIRDSANAYKAQEDAETALKLAANNNPYINGEGVKRLSEYAKELQKVTEISDNDALDVMAQLANTGRNEAEIMKIMGAAADYAAATHTDLASAAETLNATYSGMAGQLGRQHTAIKNLTEEQLKNGEAVDIIAKKYKGNAEELANADKKAINAKKSFMEALGELTKPTTDFFDNLFTNFFTRGAEAIKWFSKQLTLLGAKMALGKNVEIANSIFTNKETGKSQSGVKLFKDDQLRMAIELLELDKNRNAEEENALILLKDELRYRSRIQQEAEKEAKKNREKEEAYAKIAEAENKAAAFIKKNQEALDANLSALEVQAKAKGEAVSAQDKYNVYLQSYIDLLTKTEGTIKEGMPIEKERLEQLKEAKKALDDAAAGEKKLAKAIDYTNQVTALINSTKRKLTPSEELQKSIEEIDALTEHIKSLSDAEIEAAQEGSEAIMSQTELLDGLKDAKNILVKQAVETFKSDDKSEFEREREKQRAILELKKELNDKELLMAEEQNEALKTLDEEYWKSKGEQAKIITAEIKEYTNQAAAVVKDATDFMLENLKNKNKAELAELETRYLKGELGEEEYNQKVLESKKKAAKEEYKLRMVQWSASLLQASANIAEGITKAIAQGGVLGIITGSLVAAAGGVQIASLIASKPQPPHFAGGGFIGGMSGATMGSDNTYIHARTGEMVANAVQQKNLWDAMNGKGVNGSGTNIVINNSASNLVTAEPKISKDRIELLIDARVNESLKQGRYSAALNSANSNMGGEFYGI